MPMPGERTQVLAIDERGFSAIIPPIPLHNCHVGRAGAVENTSSM